MAAGMEETVAFDDLLLVFGLPIVCAFLFSSGKKVVLFFY